jgi:hypothetical protein
MEQFRRALAGREEEDEERRRKAVEKQHFILFRIEQSRRMQIVEFPEGAAFDPLDEALEGATEYPIHLSDPGPDSLLEDGWKQYLPRPEDKETVRILTQGSMQKRGSTPGIADDEDGTVDLNAPVSREEDLIQQQAQGVE